MNSWIKLTKLKALKHFYSLVRLKKGCTISKKAKFTVLVAFYPLSLGMQQFLHLYDYSLTFAHS